MTKPRILVKGQLAPFVMKILLQQFEDGEIDLIIDHQEVDLSTYDMVAKGGNCLPVLSEDKINNIKEVYKGLTIKSDLICDSITLLDSEDYEGKIPALKTKTIAKHTYPWYHQRNFR